MISVWLMVGILSGQSDARLLYSFESPEDLRPVKANNTRLTLVAKPVTHGKQALQIEFSAGAEWPNAMFVADSPWDWSEYSGLAFDLTNPTDEPVQFGVRVDDDPRADGARFCRQGGSTLPPQKMITYVLPLSLDPMSRGMRGLPTASKEMTLLGMHTTNEIRLNHIVAFQIFLHRPSTDVRLVVDNIRLVHHYLSLEGIVDEFGQYAKGDWKGKLKQVAEFAKRRQQEERELSQHPTLPDRDGYGGWKSGPKRRATGYFRTEKINGQWWLITPAGTLFFSAGIDCLNQGEPTFLTGREEMFTGLPKEGDPLARHYGYQSGVHSGPIKEGKTFNFYAANLERKYGREYEKDWRGISLKRLVSWGFNTIGNWSDWTFYGNRRVPYVATAHIGGEHARLSSGFDYWGKMHDPFDERFVQSVRESLRSVAQKVNNDPWCLGFFVDNELSWSGAGEEGGRYGLAYGALKEDTKSSPAKRAFLGQLKQKYGEIAQLNASWGTQFESWAALEPPLQLQVPMTDARRTDMSRFVKTLAQRYFQTVRDELKKLAPNHLYLGCRFAWYPIEAVEAAAEICDVISFNIYAPRVNHEQYAFLLKLDKPAIIGEFHFGALDRGMFHTGLVAAANQQERARMYREYLYSVLDHPAFVGCHWFQYIDQPLTGRWFDGENYNIGFVSITDTPYSEMVQAAREVHNEMYKRRFK